MSDETNNVKQEPLALPVVLKMRQAYLRMAELRAKKVVESGDTDERQDLYNFLSTVFMDHGPEFIGAYLTVQNEYAPMINVVATLLNRAQLATQARNTAAKTVKAENLIKVVK